MYITRFSRSIRQSIISSLILGSVLAIGISVYEAQAQEASKSHLEAAKNAIAATKSSSSFDNVLPGLAEQMKLQLIRNRPDKEAEITAIVDESALELAPRRADLEAEIVKIFAGAFSEAELNEMAEFFNSDAGKKFLESSPLVLRQSTRAAQIWSNGLRRDLGEAINKKIDAAGIK